MTEHSRGPWKLGRVSTRSKFQYIDAPDGNWYELAKVWISVDGVPSMKGKANARLITAAPDMIDALMQWQNAEERGDEQELSNARISRDMAINKALGRELEV